MRSLLMAAILVPGISVAAVPAASQTRATTNHHPTTQKQDNSPSPALAELQKRVAAMQAARDSGDSQAVTQASRALIAIALRQVAHLRLVEDTFPAAIDLYRRSLDFE